ncbi:MAG: NADH:ubiquinone reductase (Na(+)-transporting) subunit C [Flavobacteriales bacterium]|nr:NADH:ubiquinone reductase (Na(+)-transporting) subunit C [Flavobacteriales bacterium]
MALDINSNKYTFGFSAVLVVVVAVLLTVTSESLKPMQNANVTREKMQNILSSVGVKVTPEEAEAKYGELVKETVVLDFEGNVKAEPKHKAFDIDVLGQYKDKAKPDGDKEFPLFICEKDGRKSYIVPMVGTGLWGPIWGYMAVADDGKTVEGVSFDHKSETPGLGAEINQSWFQAPFVGKTIFDEAGEFAPIKAVKGGAADDDPHGVDAISGGTITSNGLSAMIENTLKIYTSYLKGVQTPLVPEMIELPVDSLATDSLKVDSLNVQVKP